MCLTLLQVIHSIINICMCIYLCISRHNCLQLDSNLIQVGPPLINYWWISWILSKIEKTRIYYCIYPLKLSCIKRRVCYINPFYGVEGTLTWYLNNNFVGNPRGQRYTLSVSYTERTCNSSGHLIRLPLLLCHTVLWACNGLPPVFKCAYFTVNMTWQHAWLFRMV